MKMRWPRSRASAVASFAARSPHRPRRQVSRRWSPGAHGSSAALSRGLSRPTGRFRMAPKALNGHRLGLQRRRSTAPLRAREAFSAASDSMVRSHGACAPRLAGRARRLVDQPAGRTHLGDVTPSPHGRGCASISISFGDLSWDGASL